MLSKQRLRKLFPEKIHFVKFISLSKATKEKTIIFKTREEIVRGRQQNRSVVVFAGTDVKLGQAGGIFCACDELWKVMLRDTPEAVISRAGCIALFVLAGTFAGRVWGKSIIQNSCKCNDINNSV